MTTINIKARRLHPKQQEIKQSKAKRKVAVCGRRVGKTTLEGDVAKDGLLAGLKVLYCAPTIDQTETFWNEVKRIFSPLIDGGFLYKNETKKTIRGADAYKDDFGSIHAKTGHNADSLRGDTGDIIIMDEYSLMSADVWGQVIAPMTLDNDATIYFTFTPKRKNHAYKLYLKAKNDDTGRYESWNFSSHENPYLDAVALAELGEDMTEDDYQQEIMAQFLDSAGQVFKKVSTITLSDGACNNPRHTRVCGLDWGKSRDWSCISVGCLDCRKELYIERYRHEDYRLQRVKIAKVWQDYNISFGAAESNSIGETNIEELRAAGFNVQGYFTSKSSITPMASRQPKRGSSSVSIPKNRLVENFNLMFSNKDFHLLPYEVGTEELEAYEVSYNDSGIPSYSHPDGGHDDTVDARMFMYYAISAYRPAVF